MRLAAVLLFVIGCLSLALAQERVDVRWDRNGIVRISQGRNVSRIDLSRDISGCVGTVFDSSTNQRFGSGLRKTQVVDVSSREGQHFVLLSAVAAPNCNVQGQCGAADDDVTLIWLQVGADLTVSRKQAFVAEHCPSQYVDDQPDDWRSNLKLSAGVLTLRFTESVYDSATDKLQEFSGEARHDSRSASAGIQIKRAPK